MTLERWVNKIVFGIISPPKKKFEYMQDYITKVIDWKQKHVIEVSLLSEKIFFQNHNPFDMPNLNFENIWVLIKQFSAENVLQLFKRLLFSTCNILVHWDP